MPRNATKAVKADGFEAAQQIGALIRTIRAEISILCAPEMVKGDLPEAQRQIDAVAETTEQAAHTIMDEAESIMACGPVESEADKEARDASCTRIIEACTFQDLTMQRIAKVLKTLKTLEAQLTKLQETLGLEKLPPAVADAVPDGESLDGPALNGAGVSQDSIDDMFKD